MNDDSPTFYPSYEVAQRLGISQNTLRQRKNRLGNALVEGIHWIRDNNGSVMWSDLGIELLLCNGSVTKSGNASVTSGGLGSVTEGDYFEPLLEAIAQKLVPNLLHRLTGKVTTGLGEALTRPMSQEIVDAHAITALEKIGITPVDPLALLGSSPLGYLEGTNDES